MKIETIKGMINNSTWIDPKSKDIYEFSVNNNLFINGQNHQRYILKNFKNQIVIELGSKHKYFVEYINDFNLQIHNNEEMFTIIPA